MRFLLFISVLPYIVYAQSNANVIIGNKVQIKSDTIYVVLSRNIKHNKFTQYMDRANIYYKNDTLYTRPVEGIKNDNENFYNVSACTGKYFIVTLNGTKLYSGRCDFEKFYGQFIKYYRDGTISLTGYFSDSHPKKKVGVWKFYDSEGNVKKQTCYDSSGIKIDCNLSSEVH